MATTKIWKIENRLDHVMDYTTNEEKTKNNYLQNGVDDYDSIRQVMMYATNADKTEKQFYTTGINCDVDSAVEEMRNAKHFWHKTDGILAFHADQSFKENEVTPEIGVKLAEEMWGDRFQVVVSTHLNTKHLHNHFVINSVSFKDGYKYYSNFENTALLRKTSDELCEEYGLSVLEEKKCKSGINFENFYKKHIQESDYHKEVKEDLDYAIKNSYTTKDFHRILEPMGYHYYYKFLLGLHRKNNIEYKLTPEMQKAIKKMEYYLEQIRFMCKYKLETTDAVDELKIQKLREKQIILNKRNKLYYHRNKCNNEEDKDSITKDIILVTDMLKKVKKEIKLCDVIYNNVPEMKQQIKEVEDKEQEKEQKQKKKTRSYKL